MSTSQDTRDAPGGQPGVDVAGLEPELAGEGRASTCRRRPRTSARPCDFPPNPAGSAQTGPCGPAGRGNTGPRPSPWPCRHIPRGCGGRPRAPCKRPAGPARCSPRSPPPGRTGPGWGRCRRRSPGAGGRKGWMIFRFFTPMMARAMGTNSTIFWASSSAVPTGYSGI